MFFIIFHIFLLLLTVAVDYVYNQSYHKLCHEIENKITRKLRNLKTCKYRKINIEIFLIVYNVWCTIEWTDKISKIYNKPSFEKFSKIHHWKNVSIKKIWRYNDQGFIKIWLDILLSLFFIWSRFSILCVFYRYLS